MAEERDDLTDAPRVMHGKESFDHCLAEVFRGIDLCLTQGLLHPTLILSLGVMDAFSWIALPDETNPMRRFVAWVDDWVLPHEQVLCRAIDLYAARSGWLHRMGTQSRLVESGQAAPITYCHGTADFGVLEHLRKSAAESGREVGALKLEALVAALKKGTENFLVHARTDKTLQTRMESYFLAEQPYRFPA